MSIFHLIYLPFVLSAEGNNIYPYISILVLGVLFIVSIFKLKKEDFYIFKSPIFYFLLILTIFVYKIYYPMDAGDDAFYIPFIRALILYYLFLRLICLLYLSVFYLF